jgi:hypothetical protein
MIREPSFKKGIFCAQKARWMVKNANPGFWGPELFNSLLPIGITGAK